MGASDASRYLSMQPSSVIIFASVHCPHEAPHAAPPSTARDNKRPGHQDDGGTPVVVVVVVVVKPPLHSATWRTQRKAKVEQHHPRLTIVLVSLRVDAAADNNGNDNKDDGGDSSGKDYKDSGGDTQTTIN